MRTLLLLLLGAAVLALIPAPAQASHACSVEQAKRDVAKARRAYVRATVRLREARHVLAATREYRSVYGADVARWVRLARRAGFHWHDMDMAMFIIHRESRGDPNAKNPYSTASGLFQFLSFWWEGKFDPFYPPANVRRAARAVHDGGWGPWGY